jgi:hypothetical protein
MVEFMIIVTAMTTILIGWLVAEEQPGVRTTMHP